MFSTKRLTWVALCDSGVKHSQVSAEQHGANLGHPVATE